MKLYSEGVNAVIDLEDGRVGQPFPKRDGTFSFSDDGAITFISNNGFPYPPIATVDLKDGGAETESTGTVTLDSGASGSVNGITVDGVEIMSAAESFDTSLSITAANVAANITAFSANYSAQAAGAIITITALFYNKEDANTFVVVSSVTTIATTDVDMAGGVNALVGNQATVLTYLAAILG